MSYESLARKYRPQSFQDLLGQDALRLALENAIQLKREPHAVLLTGIRGVGKTTTARIYAKALNCEKGPTATPCNICISCRAITIGNHEDVTEIDGASHTGVDDIRGIRETLQYVPQRSIFRVIIIDEVHMLSQSAFNALLKILEEPPSHVVFVFATTELAKVPQTIVSRCQTFYLQKIHPEISLARLKEVLAKENISFEERALSLIVREADGSMRDALTLLDQALALGGGRITTEVTEQMMQHVSFANLLQLLTYTIQKKSEKILSMIDQLDRSGCDFRKVCEELASLTRQAFVAHQLSKENERLKTVLHLDQEAITQLIQVGGMKNSLDLHQLFRTFVQAIPSMLGGEMDRYIFENILLEWCLDPGFEGVLKSSVLQKKDPQALLPSGVVGDDRGALLPSGVVGDDSVVQEQKPIPLLEKTFPSSWESLVTKWKQEKPLQGRLLEDVYIAEYSPEKISFQVNEISFAGKTLLQKENQKKLLQNFKDLFDFSGELLISPLNAVTTQENLSDKRKREQEEKHEIIRKNLIDHPVTQEVIKRFSATIDSVQIKNESM